MPVLASAVASANDHGYEAGRYVASHALAAFQSLPSLLFVAIGERHNQAEVVRGIRSIAGAVPLIGCCVGSVITMAGAMDKGVGVLALVSTDMHINLASASGLRQQPVLIAENAIEALQSSISAIQDNEHATLFVLAAGGAGDAAIASSMQTVAARMPDRCTLVGAAAGSSSTTHSAPVFVNDDVLDDSLAVGVVRSSVPVGVGVAHSTETPGQEAAQEAARAAVAALGERSVGAAIIIEHGADSSAATPAVESIRDIIGRATPFVGMHSSGAIAVDAGKPAVHTNAVMVYVIGAA